MISYSDTFGWPLTVSQYVKISHLNLIQTRLTLRSAVRPVNEVVLVAVSMSKLCPRNRHSFLSSIPHSIDGAVVESRNERDVDCVITFATEVSQNTD